LDLRRPRMQEIFLLRHRLNHTIREYFNALNFVEIETPILGRSTPEGARDFLVPSRVSPKTWYALPQSPQLYKQIMMVAGYDRYYQIARCFRDEDLRANRQPEFTQLDVEMSFVDHDDVMGLIEGLCIDIMRKCAGREITAPFTRLSWNDAMERFGCDKPDQRFGMEIVDVTAIGHESEFSVFRTVPAVRGLNAKGAAEKFTRKTLDELTEFAKEFGSKGLAWIKVETDKLNSPIAKFFTPAQQQALLEKMNGEPGDLLLFVADEKAATHAPLNALRNRLGKELKLYEADSFHFSWVVDFPMFDAGEERGSWVAQHHPFTTLLDDDWAKLEADPGGVKAKAYDLVVNGEEAGGGTIRIHDQVKQQRIFNFIGLPEEEAKKRFGFLLDALKFGAPPHGGIALGLDRWVMLLAGLDNIRDCIAFPKTARGSDLMTGAPAGVENKQLRELGLS
ncbi:MAG: aspartate--tRNA ligase, partial [Planctomycetia bacterium]